MPTDLPLGEEVNWKPSRRPAHGPLRGSRVLLWPVNAANDAAPLFSVSHEPDGDPAIWTIYLVARHALDDQRPADPYPLQGQACWAVLRDRRLQGESLGQSPRLHSSAASAG